MKNNSFKHTYYSEFAVKNMPCKNSNKIIQFPSEARNVLL